jgi:hypothetical protein
MSAEALDEGFQSVKRSKETRRKADLDDIQEDVWAFTVDWNWSGTLNYKKTLPSVRAGRKWGEYQAYYHLYVPSRNKVIGRKDGELQEFRGKTEYRESLNNRSTVPRDKLDAWISERLQRQDERTTSKGAA